MGIYKVDDLLFLFFSSIFFFSSTTISGQIVDFKTSITIHENGTKETNKKLSIQINNKEENWLSQVKIYHSPQRKMEFHFARLVDTKGNEIKKLKKKDLRTTNDRTYGTYYQDDLITQFELYGNEYPYILEYSYSISEYQYLNLAHWSPLLYSNVFTDRASLEVSIPSNIGIRISESKGLKANIADLGNSKVYKWVVSNVSIVKNESYSPPISMSIPHIQIIPKKFKYDIQGQTDTWDDFGNWIRNLNKHSFLLPQSEKIKIDQLVDGVTDKKEIVKRLYHYLQDHTKYINVSIDVGGLKSYPASYVSKNKYGDCKALTTYMKSMLKIYGIDSYYTIIKSGQEREKINPNLPGQQFDHVILMVPLEKDTIWLENTANYVPFNYLGTFTQGRYALSVGDENSLLIKTPSLSTQDVLVSRNLDIDLSSKTNAEVKLSMNIYGNEFEHIRYLIQESNETRIEKIFKNLINVKNFNVLKWNVDEKHRDSTYVKMTVEGNSDKILRKIGNMKAVNPFLIAIPNFEKPEKRQSKVYLPYPINRSDTSVYTIDNLTQMDVQLPESVNIENEYGQYSTTIEIINEKIISTENLTLYAVEVPLERYQTFYDFVQSIIKYKKKSALIIK